MASLNDVRIAVEALGQQFAMPPTYPLHLLSSDERNALESEKGWKRASISPGEWATQAGAYVLLDGDVVRYVGRALKGQGLATRLREHVRANPNLTSSQAGQRTWQIAVVALDDDWAWLAPSLELWIHWKVRDDGGLLNLKRC